MMFSWSFFPWRVRFKLICFLIWELVIRSPSSDPGGSEDGIDALLEELNDEGPDC